MKRAIVIGCPGSGKSTFSRNLYSKTGLPIIYLDLLFWNPDKTHLSREAFDARILEAMAGECWIMDGNYSRTIPMRLAACDTVFFLDYPLEVCMEGVASRMGTSRPDMPWVETEPDEEFLEYIRDFAATQVPQIRELLKQHSEKNIIVFHSRAEAENYLWCLQ